LPESTKAEGLSWGGHLHGVGLAERIGAEDDVEILGLARIQVERLLDEAVADGGDVERVIAGGHRRNAEMAGAVGGGAIGAAHQLNGDARKRLPAAGVYHRAADFAGRLRICGRNGQGHAKPRQRKFTAKPAEQKGKSVFWKHLLRLVASSPLIMG
jgi:hypothetical protein